MIFNKKIYITVIVEKGVLEQQMLLLVKSINKYLAPFNDVVTLVFSPRDKAYHPKNETLNQLNRLSAEYINLKLNHKYDYFPLCNGIYAASYAEKLASDEDLILLIDTDTVFVNNIENDVLNFEGLSMRPVDNKGIGSTGVNDTNDAFWLNAFSLFGMQPSRELIATTVSRILIRPYYNSGFVLCAKKFGFFNEWKSCFEKLMESEIRTDASFSRHQSDYGFLEQMSLSVAAEKLDIPTQILPKNYNYPIPFRHKLNQGNDHIPFTELRHIHYHRWFQHPKFLAHITTEDDQLSEQCIWINQHLPFHPLIDDPFKN